MFKPRVALTVAGAVIASAGAAYGFFVPVKAGCPSAFTLQKVLLDVDVMNSMAIMTTCRPAAAQLAPMLAVAILAGIALAVAGLLWSVIVWVRRPAHLADASPASTPPDKGPQKTRASGRQRSGPAWPLVIGLAIIGVGIFLGFTISVGTNCDGAFAVQTSAAGADIASAMVTGRRTNYSSICETAAGQQSVIYWGIIGFGAAVFILGLVLRTVLSSRPTNEAAVGVAGDIEQLAGLVERGVLTQEEFDREKSRLLTRG